MNRKWILFEPLQSPEYVTGIKDFMEHARANNLKNNVDKDADALCPCRYCMHERTPKPLKIVEDHLFVYGMDKSYIRWIHHGEPYNQPDVIDPLSCDCYLAEDDEAEANLIRGLYPYASQ